MSSADSDFTLDHIAAPQYTITRDSNTYIKWNPPNGSTRLHNALYYAFPMIKTEEARMQAALLDFFQKERSTTSQFTASHASQPSHPASSVLPASSAPNSMRKSSSKPRGRRKGPLTDKQRARARLTRKMTCDEHRGKKTTCDPRTCEQNRLFVPDASASNKSLNTDAESFASISRSSTSPMAMRGRATLGDPTPPHNSRMLSLDPFTFGDVHQSTMIVPLDNDLPPPLPFINNDTYYINEMSPFPLYHPAASTGPIHAANNYLNSPVYAATSPASPFALTSDPAITYSSPENLEANLVAFNSSEHTPALMYGLADPDHLRPWNEGDTYAAQGPENACSRPLGDDGLAKAPKRSACRRLQLLVKFLPRL